MYKVIHIYKNFLTLKTRITSWIQVLKPVFFLNMYLGHLFTGYTSGVSLIPFKGYIIFYHLAVP